MATYSRLEPVQFGRRSALANRGFRTVLLVLAGVPIGLAYLWYGILKPLVSDEPTDFVREYIAGGRVILHGGDPYQCGMTTALCEGHAHYLLFYPPFTYWLAQPLVRFDERVVSGIALLAANALLFASLWLVLRALRVRDWQFAVLAVLVMISFPPTLTVIQNRNSQVVVLLLIAVLLTAWLRGDRWWGGAALGLGLAIKLIQAPLLLLSVWGRRFALAAAAITTWAALWLVAVPQYLPEYLLRVAPSQAQGSGEVLNVAPFGTFNRLLHPETLFNSGGGGGALVLALSAAFALAVIAFTARRLGAPRDDRSGRTLEVATGIAASPLVVTLTYAGQFMLLLIPIIVLLDVGIRTRSRGIVAAAAVSWLLMGPSYLALTNAMAAGVGVPLLYQVWANSAVSGAVLLWITCLHALKNYRPRPTS
ncbi:MAG TPA: glycosyltransferase 87 family protein [Candidatus Dormibacteraeota bacterium]|nr:glycosyltransferase 87 family protein [Candidatus Dormibacteraeota bacterium]